MATSLAVLSEKIGSLAASQRPNFLISQISFLMGGMESLNPEAAKLIGTVVGHWDRHGNLSGFSVEHLVDALLDQTGSMDTAQTRADYMAVTIAICVAKIADACSDLAGLNVEVCATNGLTVFDIAPYLEDDTQPYSASPGPVVGIIMSQQMEIISLMAKGNGEAGKSAEIARMAGLRIKAFVSE